MNTAYEHDGPHTGEHERGTRILIVEDEAAIARDLQSGLDDMGYDVVATVDSADEALSVVASHAPDLVLMDIHIRGDVDGVDTAALLRERFALPVVYLTAYTDDATLARAALTEPFGYLVKPFTGRELRSAIEMARYKIEAQNQQRKLLEQLALSERLASLGTLAAGVAHEINNPLTLVLANTYLVQQSLERWRPVLAGDPAFERSVQKCSAALEDLRQGANRIKNIVADLMLFGRRLDERVSLIDVHGSLHWALRVTTGELRHRATVIEQLDAVPLVRANETRLGQIFVQLLLNAAQALPEDRAASNEIRVSTQRDAQGKVVIAFEDNGCGIAPSVLPHIFDPFFTTKQPGSGIGLGLSICRNIVQSLGGELRVHSDEGRGSRFQVVLPPAPGA